MSVVTLLAGRLYWLTAACRLHNALPPHLLFFRPFPGNIGHFPSAAAKVAFFLAAHVRCHSPCRTIALAIGGLSPAHASAFGLLLLEVRANVYRNSRKQSFHKFPGKSRLVHCCTPRQSLFLPDDCIASRRSADCTCLCTPPSPPSSSCEYFQETMGIS